jgi:hypothetical protein
MTSPPPATARCASCIAALRRKEPAIGLRWLYGGLSRVCRQIREEYRPLQRRAATLEIDWSDLPELYATFCNTASSSADAPCVDLQIVLQSTEGRITDLIDIFPLLRLQNLSPTFACSFMSPGDALHKTSPPNFWPSEESDLNELLYHSHPG